MSTPARNPDASRTAAPVAAWAELAQRWQALAGEWWQWWARPSAPLAPPAQAPSPGSPHPGHASRETPEATPAGSSATASDALDAAQALAALNARYRARFEALWLAAQHAFAHPQSPPDLPIVDTAAHGDRRFAAPEWDALPYFALLKQQYLLASEYWREAIARLPVAEPERHRLSFLTRQILDAMAPSNFPATNPEVWKEAIASGGASIVRGLSNLAADTGRGRISMTDAAAFEVGRNLATTPGDVVFRNDLIELLQYRPTTPTVHARPLLMVPPCINKFYILDLTPENSFVRWSVAQGHTVFMISWRNIPPELGHLTWDDYLADGVLKAIEVARAITGADAVNALGFCVGGALLASALAVDAARGERSVASLSLLTTMLDYADPGDIGVYISRELLAAREPALLAGQRVHGGELASAFASLRANELVWQYVVKNYLKGETPPAFDLLYWNSDSANLPGPMYAYYLRHMYLDNRLREPGALTMLDQPIDLSRITVPSYIYASREDHIVPWRSAWQSTHLLGGASTFVLGASGHIAGVVNPPDAHKRHHWTHDGVGADPDAWLGAAARHAGSWWPHWAAWLAPHGGKRIAAPKRTGKGRRRSLGPAPGIFVKEPAR